MLRLRIENIKWELADTATFYLREISGNKVVFGAGQFITLVFHHHQQEIRRSYSLSSSPDEELLAITVKRIPNGEISRFLLTKMTVGDILNAVEPAGKFTLSDSAQERDIVLFAAGSGIAPVFSLLKYALTRPGKSCFLLIYSNASRASILFDRELQALAQSYPERLTIVHKLSDHHDRLTNAGVENLMRTMLKHDIARAAVYTCGPFPYMRMIRLTLLYMGFTAGQIRKENFVLDTVPVAADAVSYPAHSIKINFGGETHDVMAGENQSILQAALQNNIPLPYSCRVGDCSACAAICKSGRVEMAKNNVLTDADLKEGWILTCTGHPLSDDVVITF
ncbi:MAG TPA: ferredoxin--NADP reductase [Mucilaginibacter sp.]|nr:ferredoxin--NADP reductase [Mucilaginibacter sp.]